MAEFPAEPRLAAMLLASLKFKCSEEMLTIAACCSVESLFYQGRNARKQVRCPAVAAGCGRACTAGVLVLESAA